MSKFKVGQKIKIKEFYEIAKTLDENNRLLNNGLLFARDMLDYCGKEYIISHVCIETNRVEVNFSGWVFHEKWIEQTLTQEEITLADIYKEDPCYASDIATELCDSYNIIAIGFEDELELRNGEQYTAKFMSEIDLVLDPTHESVDDVHTHAVLYKGEYLDAITTTFAKDIIKQRS